MRPERPSACNIRPRGRDATATRSGPVLVESAIAEQAAKADQSGTTDEVDESEQPAADPVSHEPHRRREPPYQLSVPSPTRTSKAAAAAVELVASCGTAAGHDTVHNTGNEG